MLEKLLSYLKLSNYKIEELDNDLAEIIPFGRLFIATTAGKTISIRLIDSLNVFLKEGFTGAKKLYILSSEKDLDKFLSEVSL